VETGGFGVQLYLWSVVQHLALLDETNLMLYNINEGFLAIWMYVTSVGPYLSFFYYMSDKMVQECFRREEITMLTQGLTLSNPRPCLSSSLSPAMEQPSSPPLHPVEPFPFEFHEPADTYGQAQVHRRVNNNHAISTTAQQAPCYLQDPPPCHPPPTHQCHLPLQCLQPPLMHEHMFI